MHRSPSPVGAAEDAVTAALGCSFGSISSIIIIISSTTTSSSSISVLLRVVMNSWAIERL